MMKRLLGLLLVALCAVGAGAYPNEFTDTVSATIDNSGTNDVTAAYYAYHTSTGTPAAGLGAKIVLGAEDSAGNSDGAVELQGYLSTVTNGSEQGVFLLRLKNAGTLQDALQVSVGSNSATIGSNQTTATLWNSTATTIAFGGAATSLTMGATTGTMTLQNATVRLLGSTLQSTDSAQFLISHAPASGSSAIRFSPTPASASDFANCDFFRTTNVNSSSANGFRIYKGDNTSTLSVTIQNNPAAITVRNSSGTANITLTGSSGDGTFAGDVAVNGNDITSTGDLNVTPAGNDMTLTSSNLKLSTVGYGLYLKEGTNATMGTATLVAGTVTVSTTKVTASSRVVICRQAAGGTLGDLSLGTVTAATSFVINSSSATDTSTVLWIIVEPA